MSGESKKGQRIEHDLPEVNFTAQAASNVEDPGGSGNVDPLGAELDRMDEEDDRRMLKELSRAKLLARVNEAREKAGLVKKPIEAMQGSGEGQQAVPVLGEVDEGFEIPEALLNRLPEMDDAKRDATIRSLERIATMKAISKGKGDMAMYSLMGFMQAKPEAPAQDVTKYMTVMLDAISRGREMAMPVQAGGGMSEKVMEKIVDKAFKETPLAASASNPVNDAITMLTKFKELNLLTQPAPIQSVSGNPGENVEMARIDADREIRLYELKFKAEEAAAKINLEDKKSAAITGGLIKIAATIGDAIGGGNLQGLIESGQGPRAPPVVDNHRYVKETCPNCKSEIQLTDPSLGMDFKCPACGKELTYGPDTGSAPPPPEQGPA